MSKLHFQHYKGIYYAFQKGKNLFEHDCWVIAEDKDGNVNRKYYNAGKRGFRIDQCIEMFKKEVTGNKSYYDKFASLDVSSNRIEKILKLAPTKSGLKTANPSKKQKGKGKKDGNGKR